MHVAVVLVVFVLVVICGDNRADDRPEGEARWKPSPARCGERFNGTIVRYRQFAREFNAKFRGFETDIHGLVKSEGNGYYVDCVRA